MLKPWVGVSLIFLRFAGRDGRRACLGTVYIRVGSSRSFLPARIFASKNELRNALDLLEKLRQHPYANSFSCFHFL